MKYKEISNLTEKELREKHRELQLELAQKRTKAKMNQFKQVGEIKKTRKTIARILTALNQKKT